MTIWFQLNTHRIHRNGTKCRAKLFSLKNRARSISKRTYDFFNCENGVEILHKRPNSKWLGMWLVIIFDLFCLIVFLSSRSFLAVVRWKVVCSVRLQNYLAARVLKASQRSGIYLWTIRFAHGSIVDSFASSAFNLNARAK